MDEANPNDKTIIFCATQVHAAAVRDLVNQYKGFKDANYCFFTHLTGVLFNRLTIPFGVRKPLIGVNKIINGKKFFNNLFGELPNLFKDEDELRTLWSNPTTRETLLEKPAFVIRLHL
jgi:hypothetical protein